MGYLQNPRHRRRIPDPKWFRRDMARLDGYRFFVRQFHRWHDYGMGRPAFESIKNIVTNQDHRYLWMTPRIAFQPARTRYYNRFFVPEHPGRPT